MKILIYTILTLNLISCSTPEPKKIATEIQTGKIAIINHEKLCHEGKSKNCYKSGEKYKESSNRELSLAYFLKGCHLKDPNSCVESGKIYEEFRNFDAAKKNYIKACKKENGLGCYHLGSFYHRFKNIKRARQNYKHGCKLKSWESCKGLGLFYYRLGKFNSGKKYLDISCSLKGEKECSFDQELSDVYLMVNEELNGHRLICNEGEEGAKAACNKVAKTQRKWGKFNLAKASFEISCNLGDTNACDQSKHLLTLLKPLKPKTIGESSASLNISGIKDSEPSSTSRTE